MSAEKAIIISVSNIQLKVTEDATVPQRVKMLRGRLEVTIETQIGRKKIKALLAEWYRERARDVFQRRLDLLIPQTLWVSERPPIRAGDANAMGQLFSKRLSDPESMAG